MIGYLRCAAMFMVVTSAFSANAPLTYDGVFGTSLVFASAIDPAGNVYVAGLTYGDIAVTAGALQTNFQLAVCGYQSGPGGPAPCPHGFVAKIDPTGTRLLYATYLGGDADDRVSAIAVDAGGNAYVTGYTMSSDFPVSKGAYLATGSGFVTKLSPDGGSVVYSTRLPSQGSAIALDSAGNAYVAGLAGTDFPTTPGAFQSKLAGSTDVFVIKLSPDGASLRYSTLIGGTFADVASALAVDSAGNAYVAGYTGSTSNNARLAGANYVPFPTTAGAYSHAALGSAGVFITKLNADGSGLVFSSVFGGSGADAITAVALDGSGAVYFGGYTYSLDFPVSSEAFQKTAGCSFAGKLSGDGSRLIYSTYIGSYQCDVENVSVDASGHAFISGTAHYYPVFSSASADNHVCFNRTMGNSSFYIELNPAGSAPLYTAYAQKLVALDSNGLFYSRSSNQILQRTDSTRPAYGVGCVTSAASLLPGPIAPGEIISLFGLGLGPGEAAIGGPDSSGRFPTSLSNVSVMIDGIAAPLLYVSSAQINAVVPFGVRIHSPGAIEVKGTGIEIEIAPVEISEAQAAPAAFTLDGSGSGQAAAINEDGTVNGPTNPAPRGSTVALWLTGFGQMQPIPTDGLISQGPSSTPVLRPTARIGTSGQPAEVTYCGDAPGMIYGAIQMNIRIPQFSDTGQLQVTIEMGQGLTATSPPITISAK